MTNFLEHLQREGNHTCAAVSWLKSIEQCGIHMKPTAIPELVGLTTYPDMKKIAMIMFSEYDSAREALEDAHIAGLPVTYDSLINNPFLMARHIDHDRTLIQMRDSGIVRSGDFLAQSTQYLRQLRQYNVNLGEVNWDDLLAKEHRSQASNPIGEIELCVASGRPMTRCKPGWSEIHPDRAKYKLGGEWSNDSLLRRVVETYHDQERFRFTDTICPECDESIRNSI